MQSDLPVADFAPANRTTAFPLLRPRTLHDFKRDVPGQRLDDVVQFLRVDAAGYADLAGLRNGSHLAEHV